MPSFAENAALRDQRYAHVSEVVSSLDESFGSFEGELDLRGEVSPEDLVLAGPERDSRSGFQRFLQRATVALYKKTMGQTARDFISFEARQDDQPTNGFESRTLSALAERYLPSTPQALGRLVVAQTILRAAEDDRIAPKDLVSDLHQRSEYKAPPEGASGYPQGRDAYLERQAQEIELHRDVKTMRLAALFEKRRILQERVTVNAYYPGSGRATNVTLGWLQKLARDPDYQRGDKLNLQAMSKKLEFLTGQDLSEQRIRSTISYHQNSPDRADPRRYQYATWEDRALMKLVLSPDTGLPLTSLLADRGMWKRVEKAFDAIRRARNPECTALSATRLAQRFRYLADEGFVEERSSEERAKRDAKAVDRHARAQHREEIRERLAGELGEHVVQQDSSAGLSNRETSYAAVEARGQKRYTPEEDERILRLVDSGEYPLKTGYNWPRIAEELGTNRDPKALGQHYRDLEKRLLKEGAQVTRLIKRGEFGTGDEIDFGAIVRELRAPRTPWVMERAYRKVTAKAA